jgi:serine/threonine protein kinase
MSKVDGTREYEKLNKIKARIETIPDYRAYFVLDVTLCIPTAPLNVECPVLEKKGIDHSKMVALNMPHGGISVSDFLREDVDIAKLHIVHRGLVKLLRNGIVELNRRNVYHGDVKDTNILVDTSTLRLIDWGLSAEYDPRAQLQIPFLTNNLPNVWRNRPLIFNAPFSIILFSDEFSIKYPRFIQENGGDDFTPTAEVLAPFVKDYVNAGKGRGHYEMICQIVRFLFGHVIKETESTVESLTDEFIVEYLVVVLLNFTAFDGVFINFKRYVDSVFTQLVDVWGLIMSYYPILGILSQTPDSKAFKQLQFIFVEYLYIARHEPIDMDDLCKDLDIFGKLLEK